jgi:hypothetical protein
LIMMLPQSFGSTPFTSRLGRFDVWIDGRVSIIDKAEMDLQGVSVALPVNRRLNRNRSPKLNPFSVIGIRLLADPGCSEDERKSRKP